MINFNNIINSIYFIYNLSNFLLIFIHESFEGKFKIMEFHLHETR